MNLDSFPELLTIRTSSSFTKAKVKESQNGIREWIYKVNIYFDIQKVLMQMLR